MTLTILCAGALAPPGTQRTGLQANPETEAPRGLAIAQLRDRLRAERSGRASRVLSDPALRRRLQRARFIGRRWLDAAAPTELPDEQWLRERFALDGRVAACVLAYAGTDGRTESPAAPAGATATAARIGTDGAAVPTGPAGARSDAPLVVRPVHLHLGLDQLVLASPAQVFPDAHEARELTASANRWLADDGLELVAERPDAWRLAARSPAAAQRLDGIAALTAPSARLASGRNIDAWLPSGECQRDWRSLENLVQMAWFEHPVNERREAEGRLPLNALWLEGRAGVARQRPFERVCTSDAALAGLAARAGARVEDADAPAPLNADTLVDAGFWRHPVAEGDLDGWRQAWQRFGPWLASTAGSQPSLHLVLTGERACIELALEPSDRLRIWRRLDPDALLETGETGGTDA